MPELDAYKPFDPVRHGKLPDKQRQAFNPFGNEPVPYWIVKGRCVIEANGHVSDQESSGFRTDQVPNLPEPDSSRKRLGEDLQPVDYAGIEPYYRVCEDAEAVQQQDRDDPDGFATGDWCWSHEQIRFLNGKLFIGLSALRCFRCRSRLDGSVYILIKSMPWVIGGFALPGGKKLTALFEEFDA